jgi:hypothetical protein
MEEINAPTNPSLIPERPNVEATAPCLPGCDQTHSDLHLLGSNEPELLMPTETIRSDWTSTPPHNEEVTPLPTGSQQRKARRQSGIVAILGDPEATRSRV